MIRIAISFLILASFTVCSCQKAIAPFDDNNIVNDSTDTDSTINTTSTLIKITQGVAEDTAYNIEYDNNNPVKISLSSTDTLYITYDTAGRITNVAEKYDTSTAQNLNYTYSADGLLIAIQGYNFGEQEEYSFEYDTNKKLSRTSFSADVGIGHSMQLVRYFTYNFNSNGDIIEMDEYNTADIVINKSVYAYTSYAIGNFKNFALINYANILGFDDVLNIDYSFNMHMPASVNDKDGLTKFDYTKDASGNISKIVSNGSRIFTHNFYYK